MLMIKRTVPQTMTKYSSDRLLVSNMTVLYSNNNYILSIVFNYSLFSLFRREREKARERERVREKKCVCVCVCERDGEREKVCLCV